VATAGIHWMPADLERATYGHRTGILQSGDRIT
jgi:hypothetical protein